MKKNTLELKKKLLLNKEVITRLTPAQQAKVVGGLPYTMVCSISICLKPR